MAEFTRLLTFSACLWGVTYIICQSWLLMWFRVWAGSRSPLASVFFYCPYCLAFWCGPGIALLLGVRDVPLLVASCFGGTGVALLGNVIGTYPSGTSFQDEFSLIEGIKNGTEKKEHV